MKHLLNNNVVVPDWDDETKQHARVFAEQNGRYQNNCVINSQPLQAVTQEANQSS